MSGYKVLLAQAEYKFENRKKAHEAGIQRREFERKLGFKGEEMEFPGRLEIPQILQVGTNTA